MEWTHRQLYSCIGTACVLQIPVNYSVEFIMVAGDTVTGTLEQWGQMLRTYYGKDDHYRKSDFSINYLG